MAGRNAKRIRAMGTLVHDKPDGSPVTFADQQNDCLIRSAIECAYSGDGIVSEESPEKASLNGRRWIIDPLDGTEDFVRGNRFWCVLIALEDERELVIGVAHFPMLGETYWAVRGVGSYLEGQRLHASRTCSIEASSFNANGLNIVADRPYSKAVMELIRKCRAVRAYGGALDACLVAAGKTEIWFETNVEPWDLAALKLILEESGALFFAIDGTRDIDKGTAIGCAPGVATDLRNMFGLDVL